MTTTTGQEINLLHVLVARDVDYMSEQVIGKKSLPLQMFIGHTEDGRVLVLGTPFDGPSVEDSKDAVCDYLREKFKAEKVVAYTTIFETWYLDSTCQAIKMMMEILAKVPPQWQAKLTQEISARMPSPSQHPDRREGMLVGAYTATHGFQRMFSIERDKDGIITALLPAATETLEGEIGKVLSGRMAELLYKGNQG